MNRYMVKVYDCSFVQDYVPNYERLFDSLDDAKAYCESIMKDFGNSALFEYSPEILIRTLTLGAYEPIGYYEFDFAHTDEDIIDMLWSLDDYKQLSNFSYHEMF